MHLESFRRLIEERERNHRRLRAERAIVAFLISPEVPRNCHDYRPKFHRDRELRTKKKRSCWRAASLRRDSLCKTLPGCPKRMTSKKQTSRKRTNGEAWSSRWRIARSN